MITLTERAINKLKTSMTPEQSYVRIRVTGGGCSGFSYKMSLETLPEDTDHHIIQDGLTVLVDPKSAVYLKDTRIDYHSDLNGAGFDYYNPNAKRSCGCGSSFGV